MDRALERETYGLVKDCGTCKKWQDVYSDEQYPCKIAKVGDQGLVSPKITINDGTYACDSYKPNLITSLRNWTGRTLPLLRTIKPN